MGAGFELRIIKKPRARLPAKTWGRTMRLLQHRHKGQNLIEYSLIVAMVSAALAAMSTYVFRAVQNKQQAVIQASTE